jgi:hypothetical protein
MEANWQFAIKACPNLLKGLLDGLNVLVRKHFAATSLWGPCLQQTDVATENNLLQVPLIQVLNQQLHIATLLHKLL